MKIIKIKDTSWKQADDKKWDALVKKVYNNPKYYDKFIEYINKNDEQLVDFYDVDLEDFVNNVVYKDGKLNEKYKGLPKNQKEFDNLSTENKAKFIRSLDKKILNEWKNKHYKDEWDKFYAFDKFFEELYDKEYHIKDSASLTFEEWKKSEDYAAEVNEAINNFLYDDGEEIIKYWNEEMPDYVYESVDEIKEDIESGANDIDNLTVGNKKLEKDLRLELESVYEKYHGMIKDKKHNWDDNDLFVEYLDYISDDEYIDLFEDSILDYLYYDMYDENEKLNLTNDVVKKLLNQKINLPENLNDFYKLNKEETLNIKRKIAELVDKNEKDIWLNAIESYFDPYEVDYGSFMESHEDMLKTREYEDSKKMKKDASEIDFDYLLSEERKAVQDYKDAIAKTSDKSALYVLSHILKEESHHIELLENLRKGKVEFEDSKDDDDFDWGVKLVELSMDNIGDYETDGTPTHIYNIIDYNFFHQNYELLKSEIQKQMEHPEDMTEFEDEFYEFTDHDDLLDFVQNNYVLRRKYQDYIEQLNKKYGKFVREDQAEKTARKIIDKIKKDIKFRR